jgi:hygromycin-B 7''-O-kinase
MSMPSADTEEQFEALKEADLQPGVRALAVRLGLSEPVRFEDGSLPVYALGDMVIKLYPPVYKDESTLESTALQAVEGRLSIPTPAVAEVGEADGWGYVLMSRLPGESLQTAWPKLSDAERETIARQLGEALATLHSLDAPEIEPDWDTFIAGQYDGCLQRQRKLGLDEQWLEQIPQFLAQDLAPKSTTSLLHTEVSREHLLVDDGRLSGLFDFEPAMVGAPEYEFAAVGLLVSQGDAGFLRTTLETYGYQDFENLPQQALAYLLLHRFSNLKAFLEAVPTQARTLDELARHWWGL